VTQQLLVFSVGFCPTDEGAYEVPCAVIIVIVMSSFEVLLQPILPGIGLHAPRMQILKPWDLCVNTCSYVTHCA